MSENFWNLNAKTWSQVIDQKLIASRQVTNQAIVDAILRLKPKSFLDIGCGEGWLCEEIAKHGIECAGIDGSAELIKIAQQKFPKLSFQTVSYQQIENGWKPLRQLDAVVFNFSLMDECLEDLFIQLKSFVSQNGSLIIQTLHPSSLPDGKEGWQSEDFKTMTLPFQGTMPWYGRNLQSWKKLFAGAGWSLEKIEEPAKEGKPLSVLFQLRS